MTRTLGSLLKSGCAIAAIAWPALANAQGSAAVAAAPAQAAPENVGDIVVTANKREENLNRVGLSITAISGNTLADRKITSVQDIAAVIPGLKYAESGTSTPIYTLRGIGFNEESLGVYPSVSVYVDEVPLPFPVLTLHSAFDLQRVEALKGPQGTLFGQNATGGAINYIAAKPTPDLHYGGDISYGRFNQIDGSTYVSGPLAQNLSARLAFTAMHRDGWQQSVSRPGDKNGKVEYYAGRLTTDWHPSDTIKFRFSVNGWQDKSEPQAAQLIAVRAQIPGAVQPVLYNSPFADQNSRAADWTPDGFQNTKSPGNHAPRSNRKFIQGALRADIDVGGWATLTSLTSYLHFTQALSTDKDGSVAEIANLEPSDAKITSFNQELRLANANPAPFRWVLGANYEKSKTFEDQTLNFGNGSSSNPGFLNINKTGSQVSQNIRNYAGFANAEYDLTSKLTLKAGGRYTDSRNKANLCGYANGDGAVATLFNIISTVFLGVDPTSFTPITTGDCYVLDFNNRPGNRFINTLQEHNFSWRVGADYKPNADTLFYANVSRGYKAGSYPTLAASIFSEYLPVTQESVTSYEAGFKASFADRMVRLNAAAFYYDYKNKQVRAKVVDPVFDVLDTLKNVPKSEVYGAEAELTVRPSRELTLQGNVTYLSSKIKTNKGARFVGPTAYGNSCIGAGSIPAPCDFTGDELPFTPKWSYGGDIDYKHEMGNRSSVFGGVSVHGQSKSVSTLHGNDIAFRNIAGADRHITSTDRPFVIPGYSVFDARLGYGLPGGQARVMLWGKNIFNKYYITNANHFLDATVRFAGMPATYGVTLSFKN